MMTAQPTTLVDFARVYVESGVRFQKELAERVGIPRSSMSDKLSELSGGKGWSWFVANAQSLIREAETAAQPQPANHQAPPAHPFRRPVVQHRPSALSIPAAPQKPVTQQTPAATSATVPTPAQKDDGIDLEAALARLENRLGDVIERRISERLAAAQPAAPQPPAAEPLRHEQRLYGSVPQQAILAPISDDPIRVLAVGDTHDHPTRGKRRFALFGHHAVAWEADWLVPIGDFTDANSFCHHVRDDTYKARQKPTHDEDLASFDAAFEALVEPIRDSGRDMLGHVTLGNHEQWVYNAENDSPQSHGTWSSRLERSITSRGFTFSPYGQFVFIGGVGFVHVPLNMMGRPAGGGKNGERTIANEATFDIVFGHTHRYHHLPVAKLGVRNTLTVVNLGSGMPDQYVGDHAENTPNGYHYGVVELVIRSGRIQSSRHVPMDELERLHGHKVADRPELRRD